LGPFLPVDDRKLPFFPCEALALSLCRKNRPPVLWTFFLARTSPFRSPYIEELSVLLLCNTAYYALRSFSWFYCDGLSAPSLKAITRLFVSSDSSIVEVGFSLETAKINSPTLFSGPLSGMSIEVDFERLQ